MLERYGFGDLELEGLYRKFIYKLRLGALVAFLALFAILTAALSVLDFVYVSRVTVDNLYNICTCGVFSLLLVYVHSRYMTQAHLPVLTAIVFAMCACFSIIALPLSFGDRPRRVLYTPVEGVWELALVVFTVHALLPVRMYVALATGLLLPAAHVLVSVFLASDLLPELLWRQVSTLSRTFATQNVT